MATLATHPTEPAFPHIAVARRIHDLLQAGEAIDARRLRQLLMAQAGGSDACGRWSMREAFAHVPRIEVRRPRRPGLDWNDVLRAARRLAQTP